MVTVAIATEPIDRPAASSARTCSSAAPKALSARGARVADAVQVGGAGAGGDQVAAVVFAGPRDQLGDSGGADPAPRRADRAPEGLRVDRVGDQGQVGERVADLGALVEAEAAQDAVGHAGVRERALQRLGGIPGPRQREDLGRGRSGRRAPPRSGR